MDGRWGGAFPFKMGRVAVLRLIARSVRVEMDVTCIGMGERVGWGVTLEISHYIFFSTVSLLRIWVEKY